MSCLRYLCLFAYSGAQHISRCVFVLFFFVLPVSLDCSFLIALSVFSNVYLHTKQKSDFISCFSLKTAVRLLFFFLVHKTIASKS